jgi:hypothetical protein
MLLQDAHCYFINEPDGNPRLVAAGCPKGEWSADGILRRTAKILALLPDISSHIPTFRDISSQCVKNSLIPPGN